MSLRSSELSTTIRTEGGLLPSDLLVRISEADAGELGGLSALDYHLAPGERINEAITRAWNRSTRAWQTFRTAISELPEKELGTSLSRERWLLILFQELGFGRLQPSRGFDIGGKHYPISHLWGRVPIHLVGFRVDLDRRTAGVPGAARTSPHGLVQEFLNRSTEHLWGVVSNGLHLRILRNNASLTRQAFLEFDLGAMMEGEVYADFVLLWLMCHESRFEGEKPEDCWLERWSRTAHELGTRALEGLRRGVEEAIKVLGSGFLSQRANVSLRERLRCGELSTDEYYRQILRLVYRMLFLFVAEDRNLLLDPKVASSARERYLKYYSSRRLRHLAERQRGTKHPDLYQGLRLVMGLLGCDEGCGPLALPALGSFLWSREAVPDLVTAELANHYLLAAVRALAFMSEDRMLRQVDYKNLGSEELGSVYECLLELHPEVNTDAATFDLKVAAGHERKTTGSYYTPSTLVQCLLDSALDPVLEETARQSDPERAILSLKVCDPACGSGHFLIAAAHRIARRLAAVRTGDEEPSPAATRTALRDVIGRCLYGVDVNPMAVELCKVGLWMEALEPGKPLSFLDHRIQCGNSLLGTTPALMANGIPDEAFQPIEGDDKKVVTAWRRRNREEREGQTTLPLVAEPMATYEGLAHRLEVLNGIPDDTIAGIHEKQVQFCYLADSSEYQQVNLEADAWCAAFIWRKASDAVPPVTHDLFIGLQREPKAVPASVRAEVKRLKEQYQFFHWHLAFPDVFRLPGDSETSDTSEAGWKGGFDVVLGNPPWDMQEIKDNEFFASAFPEILSVKSAKEKGGLLERIKTEDQSLWGAYVEYRRIVNGQNHLITRSGRLPHSAIGRLNLYRLFVEVSCTLMSARGRVGMVIPSGFASDTFAQAHFRNLFNSGRLISLWDFENREGLFPAIDSRYRFCLLTVLGKPGDIVKTDFVFFAHSVSDLRDSQRHVWMSHSDVADISPLSGTPPQFRTPQHLELTKQIHHRSIILCPESTRSGWIVRPRLMFMMNASMTAHRTAQELEVLGARPFGNRFRVGDREWLPFYEGKMVGMFDHRAASIFFDASNRVRRNQPEPFTLEQHQNPNFLAIPMFWVSALEVRKRCGIDPRWLLAVKDVTSATNERTVIGAILPRAALTDSVPWLADVVSAPKAACLLAAVNSFAADFVARQKVSGLHLRGHYLNQLPVPPPELFARSSLWLGQTRQSLSDWLLLRILELSYTAWDLEPFAQDCGFDGPPFRWEESRRFQLRCELDAAFFQLYLGPEEEWCRQPESLTRYFPTPRQAVDYILETFPIVKRRDVQRFGEYRTKHVIQEIYDAMQKAIETGVSYDTVLDPPPADPRCCHPPRGIHFRPLTLRDLAQLPADVWARPAMAQRVEWGAILAAILKAITTSQPTRHVRLAALLAAEPQLLTSFLTTDEANMWRRLVGKEADTLPPNIRALVPTANRSWGDAVTHLRGNSMLLEDLTAGTWAPGQGLDSIQTDGWPEGRVQMVLSVLSRRSIEEIIKDLPESAQRWIDAQAA